jgi:hypothetical protein
MKNIFTLSILLVLAFSANVKSQCSSTQNYDLIVSGSVVLPPSPTSQYISAYVCTTGTLVDSMSCCTRMIHVEPGGTLIVGPLAYGAVYLKSGATFDAQNSSMSWMVFAEAGAIILNYSGTVNQCVAVTFPSANCITSVGNAPASSPVSVIQRDGQLQFDFSATVGNLRVELYDMSGRLVSSENATNANRHTISLAGLSGGVYFCRVYGNEAVLYAEKVVVTAGK